MSLIFCDKKPSSKADKLVEASHALQYYLNNNFVSQFYFLYLNFCQFKENVDKGKSN